MNKMAVVVTGNRETTSWVVESVYNTLPTTGLIILKNAVLTPSVSKNWEEINNGSGGNNTLSYQPGTEEVSFNLTYNPQNWRELVMVIGTATNTDSGGYYTHTFSQNSDKSIPSFSVQRVKKTSSDLVDTYTGCKIDTFTISWNTSGGGNGKFVNCSMDIIGSGYSITDTEKTTEVSPSNDTLFQSRQVILTINNNVIAETISGTIIFNNKLNDSWYGGETRSESNPTFVKVSGQLVVHQKDNSLFTLYKTFASISNTQLEFRRTATSDTGVFPLTNFKLVKSSDPTKIQDVNIVTWDYTADYCLPVVTDSRSDYE